MIGPIHILEIKIKYVYTGVMFRIRYKRNMIK